MRGQRLHGGGREFHNPWRGLGALANAVGGEGGWPLYLQRFGALLADEGR